MKKKYLVKRLRVLGWWLKREGASHEIWTNGDRAEPVPRHSEINELLAKKILKLAENEPGQKKE